MKLITLLAGGVLIGIAVWVGTGSSVSSIVATSPAVEPAVYPSYSETETVFDAPPEIVPLTEVPIGRGVGYRLSELATWERPEGPWRVGVQSGHWDNGSVPDELRGLIGNTGAQVGSVTERDVVRRIAELVQIELEAAGVEVDVLPTVVPPGYVADAFVSIHADGNRNTAVRGFKIAPPRRDYSGLSAALVASLYASYAAATNLPTDSVITNRMTAYYAFNWPRYEHAIHPRTPAAIVETGFLTNATDRTVIVDAPERAAVGIARGILDFLAAHTAPDATPLPLVTPQLPLTGALVCAPLRAERIARGQQSQTCTYAVQHESGFPIILVLADDSSEVTSLAAQRGQTVTVTGDFMPVQTLDNYFWLQYEVLGLLQNPRIDAAQYIETY